MRIAKTGIVLSFVAAAGLAVAQDANQAPQDPNFDPNGAPNGAQASPPPPPPDAPQNPNNGGWRRLGSGDAAAAQQRQGPPPQGFPNGPQGYPNGQAGGPPQGYPPAGFDDRQAPPPVPAELRVQPGTFLTVRVNQLLTTDRNQTGDAFSATLVKPLVVDGVIVADRGQTIAGRVTQAQKAGRVEGVSKLGIELTDLSLVSGEQVPLKTSLISREGPTTVGRDVAAVGGTTALGAALGAAVGWGRGAAIGAGAGAAAGIAGVLLTRGAPTAITPESVLTFRIDNPITVNTARAPQAFRYVGPYDYQQPGDGPRMQARPGPAPYGPYGPYYGPYAGPYYGYPYYPYYYGPSIGIGFGYGRYYGHRWR